jgi:glyceraldehyde 3-phosphate dehydrogenase
LTQQTDAAQAEWSAREELIPLIGRLYRENNVVPSIHGRKLINKSATDLLKAHRIVRHYDGNEMDPADSLALLSVVDGLDVGAVSLDLAALNIGAKAAQADGKDLSTYLSEQLAEVAGKHGASPAAPRDIVLYGFGRIGRLLARILIERGGYGLRLRAVVVRRNGDEDLVKRASLLRRDTIHGPFDGSILVDQEKNTIQANGTLIQVIYSSDPTTVDYTAYGINDAIVVDNTGRWRDQAGLEQHLKSKGVSKVLLTAPGKGELKNIVHGVNDSDIEDSDTILSAAS